MPSSQRAIICFEIFFTFHQIDIIILIVISSSSFSLTANSSPKMFGPSYKRIEGLSLVEQNELKGAAWFQAGIPREISLEVLSRQSPGAFLVRQSSTKPGCFALSLRVPPPAPKVAHYLILRTSRGYKIKVRIMFILNVNVGIFFFIVENGCFDYNCSFRHLYATINCETNGT